MSALYLGTAWLLLLLIAAGMVRILHGPTRADRALAAQLFGTTGTTMLLLLAQAFSAPALVDVALVFALLAAITAVAFVRRVYVPLRGERDDPHGR